jgi:alpha-glucosidase
LDKVDLSLGVELGQADRYQVKQKYPWRGVHAEAVNRCNGARIPVTHTGSKTTYTVEMRAFNDGVAFRHILPGNEKPAVPDDDHSR